MKFVLIIFISLSYFKSQNYMKIIRKNLLGIANLHISTIFLLKAGTVPTVWYISGADPGFQVRGAHLKKLRRAEGGAKNFGVFRVKNHDFTPKKSDFFQMQREARNFVGYFVWKITILRQKILFFPILGGRPPPLDPPLMEARMCWEF